MPLKVSDSKNKADVSTVNDTEEESRVINCVVKKDSYLVAASNGPH